MAQTDDINTLLSRAQNLLRATEQKKKTVKKAVNKKRNETKFCTNHPHRIVYRGSLCEECDSNKRNLANKRNAEREPWESTDGYLKIYRDDGTIAQYHRFVIEKSIGRRLDRSEVVKFRDGNKLNCELDNLMLLSGERMVCTHCGKEN